MIQLFRDISAILMPALWSLRSPGPQAPPPRRPQPSARSGGPPGLRPGRHRQEHRVRFAVLRAPHLHRQGRRTGLNRSAPLAFPRTHQSAVPQTRHDDRRVSGSPPTRAWKTPSFNAGVQGSRRPRRGMESVSEPIRNGTKVAPRCRWDRSQAVFMNSTDYGPMK